MHIPGLTPQQQLLAEQLWHMDSQQSVDLFIHSLPPDLQADAQVVVAMFIAEYLDQLQDVNHSVIAYLSGF